MAAATSKKPQPSTNRRRAKASETPRPSVSFRLRADIYERLKASAEARAFSLSEEIEHRLNRSLDTAGDHFAELALQLISDNWRSIQSLSRRKMVEDKFTLQACCEAAYRATELLAGVNGINMSVGALDSLGPEGINIDAAKQLGRAIVMHRELLHMKDPPKWATSVYEANVIEALTKRIAYLQGHVGEATAPGTPEPDDEPRLTGQEEATRLMAGAKPARGILPPEIGDRALFDETMGDPRHDDGDEPPPAPAATPAPTRRRRAKAET